MLKKYYLSLTTRVFISSYWSDFRDLYYNLEIIKLCYNEGFIKENGIPALFMDTFHCGDKEAFWIPYSLGGGVWAYYTMWGSFWYIKRERSAATLWYMAFTKRFH